jgi:integrase
MSSIWAEAVRLDYSDRNVVRDTRLPRATEHDDDDGVTPEELLTPQQIDALLAAAGVMLRPLVLLGAACGLRPGESAALRVRDINTNAGTLTVAGSLSHTAKRFQDGESLARKRPKNRTSRRTIGVPQYVLTELAGLLEGRSADAPLVVGRNGAAVRWDNVRDRQWAQALAVAGIDDRFTPHDLRHYCASRLISAGVPITAVASYLGHSTPNETLRTYARLFSKDSGLALGALEVIWPTR